MLRMCLMLCGMEREVILWLSFKPVYVWALTTRHPKNSALEDEIVLMP